MKHLNSITGAFIFMSFAISFSACKKDETPQTTDCTNSKSYSVTNGLTCNQTPTGSSQYSATDNGITRSIRANGIANHQVGQFPNAHNPNTISAQNHSFTVTSSPAVASTITPVFNETFQQTGQGRIGYQFGIIKSGVTLDPVAAEFWENPNTGEKNYTWAKEALSINNNLGVDCNNAHVQPNGNYHYHGTPQNAVANADANNHSELLGYAADGFPIYYKYVYATASDANSGIKAMTSSYQIKMGCRTGDGLRAPDGAYDGTYVPDYEYVAGLGDLDECNGRTGVTPEYQGGTYYYVITDGFPSIPRCFMGTPDASF